MRQVHHFWVDIIFLEEGNEEKAFCAFVLL
jgi:hypothetical protein